MRNPAAIFAFLAVSQLLACSGNEQPVAVRADKLAENIVPFATPAESMTGRVISEKPLNIGSDVIEFESECARLTVWAEASGKEALGIPPRLVVFLNGSAVYDDEVPNTAWEPIIFSVYPLAGRNRLELRIMNDFWDPERGLDRNLYIRQVRLIDCSAREAGS